MSQIQLRAEDLYDKEKVDLETIVVEDVFKLLQCDDAGLTEEEALRRLELFGPNKLESEEQNAFLQVHLCTIDFVFYSHIGVSSSRSCGIRFPGLWKVPRLWPSSCRTASTSLRTGRTLSVSSFSCSSTPVSVSTKSATLVML